MGDAGGSELDFEGGGNDIFFDAQCNMTPDAGAKWIKY
jgi:hypothetical protein